MSDVGEKLLLGNDVGEEIIAFKIPISPVKFFIHGKILPPTCVQADIIMTVKVIVNTKMKAAG